MTENIKDVSPEDLMVTDTNGNTHKLGAGSYVRLKGGGYADLTGKYDTKDKTFQVAHSARQHTKWVTRSDFAYIWARPYGYYDWVKLHHPAPQENSLPAEDSRIETIRGLKQEIETLQVQAKFADEIANKRLTSMLEKNEKISSLEHAIKDLTIANNAQSDLLQQNREQMKEKNRENYDLLQQVNFLDGAVKQMGRKRVVPTSATPQRFSIWQIMSGAAVGSAVTFGVVNFEAIKAMVGF